jgi:hypothetical protein
LDDLQKLLSTVESLDEDKREKEESPPTDEELAEARAGLIEAAKAALEGDKPDNASGRTIKEAIDKIDAEVITRREQVEADRKEAAELLKSLEGEPKAEAEGDEGEGDSGDAEGDGGEGEGGEEEAPAEAKQVAKVASLADAISRSSKRRTQRIEEQPPSNDSVIVAALGPAQGAGLSQNADIDDVAKLFTQYAPQVKRGGSVLVHMERLYPEDRSLGLSAEENTRTIDKVTSPRAITAAGGICEPLPADFNHPICGDRGRPIFNANPTFRADRGGIRFAPSVTVADLEEAITVWTNTTDAEPGSDTKACPRVECEEEDSAKVDAIVACLTVGNFQARFNPEFWRSRLDLLMVAHDRIAEQTMYATIESNSTQVSFGGGSGTVVDVLTVLDQATAGLKSRHRLIGTGFTAILPSWLREALRVQLNNQAPAGSLDLFTVADAQLNAFFTSRNITPVWSPDIDVFADQGVAALVDFGAGGVGGDGVDVVLYPNGTWLTLDGGTYDLGTNIADSTLNAVNDRQAFLETFEGVVQRGCESLSIAVPLDAPCICGAA